MDHPLLSRARDFLRKLAHDTPSVESAASNTTMREAIQNLDYSSILAAISEMKPLLPTYAHLMITALLPIYAGAHASLSRPSTAAKPPKKPRLEDELEAEDDEDDYHHRMESMTASDALAFPILAGITLTSLYFIIKWLQDPAILNKILNVYFAGFSTISVARLVSDALDVAHSLAFPRIYRDQGVLYRVDPYSRRAIAVESQPSTDNPIRRSPLPGPLSRVPFPQSILNTLWFLKRAPSRKFTLNLELFRTLHLRTKIQIHQLEGLAVGLLTVAYYNFVAKPWPLTNLSGFGFAYGALQLMSPTTFTTGTLLLLALFVYDVYMVFFTPMMVTVAKSLDIPVKMEFPRPEEGGKSGLAMLGLGDVVLPGIMVGLALRFDLWSYYLKKQRTVKKGTDEKEVEVAKEEYRSVSGRQGDRLWTSGLLAPIIGWPGNMTRDELQVEKEQMPNAFPKPYFLASMLGYIVGLMTTLLAMQISDLAQPALLYLVPGVLGAILLTGLIRGEMKQLWDYTELEDENEDKQGDKEDDKQAKTGARGQERGAAWAEYFGIPASWITDNSRKDRPEGPETRLDTGKEPDREKEVKEEKENNDGKDKEASGEEPVKLSWFSLKLSLPPPIPTSEDISGNGEVKKQI